MFPLDPNSKDFTNNKMCLPGFDIFFFYNTEHICLGINNNGLTYWQRPSFLLLFLQFTTLLEENNSGNINHQKGSEPMRSWQCQERTSRTITPFFISPGHPASLTRPNPTSGSLFFCFSVSLFPQVSFLWPFESCCKVVACFRHFFFFIHFFSAPIEFVLFG